MISSLKYNNLHRTLFRGEEVIGKRLRFVNRAIYAGKVEAYLYEESFHPTPERTTFLYTEPNSRFGRLKGAPERRTIVSSAVVIRGERVGIFRWGDYELIDLVEPSDA